MQFELTDLTNQVGHFRVLSLCRSRKGTMSKSSTRLTMARGTWMKQRKVCKLSVGGYLILHRSKSYFSMEDVQSFTDTTDHISGGEENLRETKMREHETER